MASCLKVSSQLLLVLISSVVVIAEPVQKTGKDSSQYSPQPQDFQNERLFSAYHVIQHFKRSITLDPKNVTATWTGHDICGATSYRGFYCAAPQGRANKLTVTAVILNGFGLHAPRLHGFIDQLPDLALFHAASNSFGGEIPRLTSLAYPYKLNVESKMKYEPAARFYGHGEGGGDGGCITATISFDFNIQTKKPHTGMGSPRVTDSKALLLNYNSLSGQLPADLGFSKLSYLALANNKLTGPIPPSIGHLQDSLFEVLLLNNQLSGCLPHELGSLHKATVIDAGKNQLTGPIPSSFSCLSSVEQLNLAENRLYGAIPDALCKLAGGPAGRLANLTLSGNYFTSVGPACAALIKDGVLDVKNNCIPGLANQRRPAECAAFQSQPKTTCPAVSTQVTCPATAATNAAPAERKARDYSSYVTYATLHE